MYLLLFYYRLFLHIAVAVGMKKYKPRNRFAVNIKITNILLSIDCKQALQELQWFYDWCLSDLIIQLIIAGISNIGRNNI